MDVDILELYRWAVQDPHTHAAVMVRMYRQLRDGRPQTLREDFAGTSAESVAWVAADPSHRAFAVDRDQATIDWARRRARRLLGDAVSRLQFVTADVGELPPLSLPAADVLAALNFSLLYFHDRDALRSYFRLARQALAPEGILVGNLFGGPGAMRRRTDVHRVEPVATGGEAAPPPFEYRWEQRRYDAMNGRLECRIHFALDQPQSGAAPRVIEDAFVYDWRLWSLPELVELLREAGFCDAQVWRHTYDASLGREGVFLGAVDALEDVDLWTAYVIGLR